MRIKEYKRLSLYGTVAFLVIAVIGMVLALTGRYTAGAVLLIVGLSGTVVASAAIRLYGRMTADAFFKGNKIKEE